MDNSCLMMTVKDLLENESHIYKISSGESGTIEKTIKLSQDRTYSIPAYQREIRWTAKNVNILINDLCVGKKFLGTILLNKRNDHSFEIIDGQQRISVFVLILKSIEKLNSDVFNLCAFSNKTYDCMFEALELDFDVNKIMADRNAERYLNSDILEQRGRFEEIWKAICKKLASMTPEQLSRFRDNLLYSEVNIIFADDSNSRIYVDYYLDLNDKSVKLDNIDILKANLFRINYGLMSTQWADVQKAIKEFRVAGVNYSIATYYHHYFACTVNKYLRYKLTGLKTDLKFTKDTVIGGHTFESGTDILRAVGDQKFFQDAVVELKAGADFFKNAYKKEALNNIKEKMRAANCDNCTIECAFAIINAILHNDDEVPKILILKYFLDVLSKEQISKSEVKVIFYIYVYSILFNLTAGKKESAKLIRVVISEDWISKLQKITVEFYFSAINKIDYFKKITQNGKVTKTSGQYLPKHIIAIKEFAKIQNDFIKFNENSLREYLLNASCTAEHFFINESCTIEFHFGTNNPKIEKIGLPKKLTKYISCPVNYLYITSDANNDLGNKTIKEKIDMLDTWGESAFVSEMNYKHFQKIKEAFKEVGGFPDLSTYTAKGSAVRAIRKYYNENLLVVMQLYANKVKDL